jgi:alginate O-acetyltransferase complex protein AlgI
MTGAMAWCAAIFYTLQIYYDFSGYSDMAIGLGRIFGFEFLENFNYPYISSSIKEFWRRWHISLSSWFRDYLYIPLGGNRKGKSRTYLNLFIVFFMTGLWHGASWNFVFWGLYHGFFLIIERMGFSKVLEKSKVFAHIYTILVFIVGWVFFREESMKKALAITARMFTPWTVTQSLPSLGTMVSTQTIIAVILGILGCGLIQKIFTTGKLSVIGAKWKISAAEAVWLTAVLFYSILLLANNTYNPFIYFRF